MAKFPVISIITPSFNQGDFLEETILSVLSQNYPALEYFIMDGGSTDNSVEIIEKYENQLTGWVSEKDNGQADAINKGFKQARGEYIAFLNSDDLLAKNALNHVVECITKYKPDWIAGAVRIFGENADYGLRNPEPSENFGDWLLYNAQIPQQGSFWRRELLDTAGFLDTDLHFAFDLEYWIRLLQSGCYPRLINQEIAGFRIHDITKSMGGRSKFIYEHMEILERYKNDVSREERNLIRQRLHQMLSDAKIYESAANSENGNSSIGKKQLKEAISLYPPVLFKRHFWGAVRKLGKR